MLKESQREEICVHGARIKMCIKCWNDAKNSRAEVTTATTICERCGKDVDCFISEQKRVLFPYDVENDEGNKKTVKVCWYCDNEIMNGDPVQKSREEIWEERDAWMS